MAVYLKLRMVPCSEEYWEFVRLLRMDPQVQKGFIDQNPMISAADQEKYMLKYGDNYRVCVARDNGCEIPVGYIGVVNNDIRLCVHPGYQKKGVALFMLKRLIKEHPQAVARVKVNNEASFRLFQKAGFKTKMYWMEYENE